MAKAESHDLAAFQRLALAGGFSGPAIREEILDRERFGMGQVRIQRVHQGRPFLNDPHPGMTMAMNPPLMPLGHAEPALQIEIVRNRFDVVFTHEEPRLETRHQLKHVGSKRIFVVLKAIDQGSELLRAMRPIPARGVQGRCHLTNLLHVLSNRRLFLGDRVQTAVDAVGQATQLLLSGPPFFASKLRWIDSCTSSKASAIRRPGGCSGPP